MSRRLAIVAWIALTAIMLSPGPAAAQRDEEARWFLGFPNWTIELYGGLSNFGRFLLQSPTIVPLVSAQRELTADNAFGFGGSIGATILPRTTVRLAFTHTSTELDYEDDTGNGSDLFDIGDVADLSSNILSIEAIRFLLPERIRLVPYGGLGFALAWWSLDDEEERDLISSGGDNTRLRLGGVGILGLQYRVSWHWRVRLEATTFGGGNPFSGEESFRPLTGFTIDEPTTVRQTLFRLAVAYTFGGPGRARRGRR
ncbi:MAG TPA: hypothetical protein VF188_01075 [Longimicrobiales bacterium]